ncbi:MAG: hypothetical protein Q7J25_04730 [Vicinamibacterales bacterium]|nr:hypothetical protein [Vicinamibacterales bacterium]
MTPLKAARVLLVARALLLAGAFVLSVVWAWRHEGLFRVFTATQQRLTGNYDASFAALFTFLTMFVAAMAASSLVTSLMRRRFSREEWQAVLVTSTALWDGPKPDSHRGTPPAGRP